jgi:hypothetical protein
VPRGDQRLNGDQEKRPNGLTVILRLRVHIQRPRKHKATVREKRYVVQVLLVGRLPLVGGLIPAAVLIVSVIANSPVDPVAFVVVVYVREVGGIRTLPDGLGRPGGSRRPLVKI